MFLYVVASTGSGKLEWTMLKFNQGLVQSVEFLKYENLRASFSDLGNEGKMRIRCEELEVLNC